MLIKPLIHIAVGSPLHADRQMLFLPPVFGTKLGSNTWMIFRRQADIRLIEEMLLVDAIRKLRQVADREITLPGFEGVEGLLIQGNSVI